MSKTKNPQQKKADEYGKDHRTAMEHPHAFSKNWPGKKARINRRERRKMDSTMQIADENLSAAHLKTLKLRGMLRKQGVRTLGSKVKTDKARRAIK